MAREGMVTFEHFFRDEYPRARADAPRPDR